MKKDTILVVDDTAQILKLSRDIFEMAGFNVITAMDGEQALRVLADEKIDLVVTDILMPNTDGYLLCYTMRTTEKLKDIPVIIYSATYTSFSDEEMAMEMGADKFIRKPASMDELIAAARDLLSDSGKLPHKIPAKPKSLEAARLYYEGLAIRLEARTIELIDRKEKLEQGESRLNEAQTIAHLGSWEIDMEHDLQHWSDEMFNIFGIIKGEGVPSTELFLSFIHPDDLDFVSKKIDTAFKTLKDSMFDFRFIRKGGALRQGYSKYRFEFNKDRKPVRLSGIVQDITEKMQAAEALQNAHDRLVFHIENAPLGFIEWDDQLLVKSWSKRAEEIFGWTEKEFVDAGKTGYSQVYEEDRPVMSKIAHQLVSGELTRNRVQHRNYTKDGRVIWCEWFNSALKDKEGKVITIMSLVQDITDQKTMEVIQREKLERLVEERTHKLNESLKKEKELVEMRNKFVSIASHEFRTPLSTISFAAESIRNYFHQLTAEEIKRKLIKIEDQTSHMTNLLEDILTLGKSETGKIKVKRISLDLKEFMESLIEEVRATVKEKREINFTFSCDSHKVNADDKLLRNVFNNLLTNALKFSSAGTPVTIAVSDFEGEVLIEVADEGIGIEESELTSVFESFQRGSNASAVQGTGLGLSILKKAVELMDGTVEVKSCVNKGSTFRVQIPLR